MSGIEELLHCKRKDDWIPIEHQKDEWVLVENMRHEDDVVM